MKKENCLAEGKKYQVAPNTKCPSLFFFMICKCSFCFSCKIFSSFYSYRINSILLQNDIHSTFPFSLQTFWSTFKLQILSTLIICFSDILLPIVSKPIGAHCSSYLDCPSFSSLPYKFSLISLHLHHMTHVLLHFTWDALWAGLYKQCHEQRKAKK